METRVCNYNGHLNDPAGLIFSDTTIREAEQCPGIIYSLEEKIEFMHRLDEIGIQQLQFYPGKTKQSQSDVKRLLQEKTKAPIMVMALGFEDCWLDNAKFALECGTQIAHMSFYTTPYVDPVWTPQTPEKTRERMLAAIEFYRSQTQAPIEIGFIDATRADVDYLMSMVESACKAGANHITLADTVSAASPEGIEYLVSRAVEIAKPYGTLIGTHCHNDVGLALANTCAGIKAGARLIDVAVNGLGDRAGNVVLAELVAALEVIYGIRTPFNLKKMNELARFAAQVSAREIPVNAPIVGDHVFVDQDDYHIDGSLHDPLAFRIFHCEDFGGESRIMFGKITGPAVIRHMSKKYNRPIDESLIPAIREELFTMASNAPKGLCINEEMFWQAVERIQNQ